MIRDRLILACQKLCARCAMGHEPLIVYGRWQHCTDARGEPFAPPEHCAAWSVWEVIAEREASAQALRSDVQP